MREAPARRCLGELDPNAVRVPGDLRKPPGPLLPVRAREAAPHRQQAASGRRRARRGGRAARRPRRRRSKCRCRPRSAPSSSGAQTERWAHGNAGRPRSVARAPRHRGPGRRASRAVSRARRVRRRESALERSRSRRRARRLRATASGRRRWFDGQDGAAPARCAPATADDGRLHWCRRAVVRALGLLLRSRRRRRRRRRAVCRGLRRARASGGRPKPAARPEDASTPRAAAAAPRQDTSASVARTRTRAPRARVPPSPRRRRGSRRCCSADSAPTHACAFDETEPAADAARGGALARVLGARARRRGRGARRARAASSRSRAAYRTGLCSSTRSSAAARSSTPTTTARPTLPALRGELRRARAARPGAAVRRSGREAQGPQASRVAPSVADIEAHITEWRETSSCRTKPTRRATTATRTTMCSCGSMPPLSAPRFDNRAWSRQRRGARTPRRHAGRARRARSPRFWARRNLYFT